MAQSLAGKAASVKVVELPGLPEKGDVSDFLNAGGTVDQLDELARDTPEWHPPTNEVPSQKVHSVNGAIAGGILADSPIVSALGLWKYAEKNSRLWLEQHGKVVKYDEFLRILLVDGVPVSEELIADLAEQIETDTRSPWAHKHIQDAVLQMGFTNRFNPLTEYLDSLKWDGTGRIDNFFFTAYGASGTRANTEAERVLFRQDKPELISQDVPSIRLLS